MTGFHALHVLIGIGLVAYIAYRNWKGAYGREYTTRSRMSGSIGTSST